MTVPAIEQVYYEVERRSKLEVLCRIIDLDDVKLGIVFCATKVMVDELTSHLVARGYRAEALHGDLSQAMRERVMGRFRKRQCEFLVATDVAARGLDVDDVEVVFNYDLPHDGEDYVHRVGRTGRAGRSGKAITFVAGREIYRLQNIQRFTKARIQRARVPSLDEVEERRTESLSSVCVKRSKPATTGVKMPPWTAFWKAGTPRRTSRPHWSTCSPPAARNRGRPPRPHRPRSRNPPVTPHAPRSCLSISMKSPSRRVPTRRATGSSQQLPTRPE